VSDEDEPEEEDDELLRERRRRFFFFFSSLASPRPLCFEGGGLSSPFFSSALDASASSSFSVFFSFCSAFSPSSFSFSSSSSCFLAAGAGFASAFAPPCPSSAPSSPEVRCRFESPSRESHPPPLPPLPPSRSLRLPSQPPPPSDERRSGERRLPRAARPCSRRAFASRSARSSRGRRSSRSSRPRESRESRESRDLPPPTGGDQIARESDTQKSGCRRGMHTCGRHLHGDGARRAPSAPPHAAVPALLSAPNADE
jgi:hypothetical protein